MKKKVPVVKFHENPSIGNLVGTCRQADMTKLIAAFHTFANVSKNRLGNVTVAYIYDLFILFCLIISENIRDAAEVW